MSVLASQKDMFGKKKPPTEPDYSKMPVLPPKLAEFVQAQHGLTTDELHKLLAALGRVREDIEVARRRPIEGKNVSKLVGGRKAFKTIMDAVQYTQERAESRHAKDEKIHELLEEIDFNKLMIRLEVNDSIYPKRLAPIDIVHYVDSAGKKLDELDRDRAKPVKIYSPREEAILDVITLVKKQEPLRLARRVADRQKRYILSRTTEQLEAEHAEWLRNLKGEPPPETEEQMMERLTREAAEQIEEARVAAEEAARNFEDLPSMHTLLDDVATLIRENPEAAAAIVRQWIGNAVLIENKS